MRITLLTNDKAKDNYLYEHGLSLYIETNTNKKILFDTGASDVFIKNANSLGIDIGDIDFVVLSHGHNDHGNGLKFLKNKPLVCHPSCFVKKYRKKDGTYIGLNSSLKEVQKNFNLILSKKPYKITEDVIFLGEIPRENSFEAKETPFFLEDKKDDFIYEDSGLAITTRNGLVVVAGCAHAGICNIIEYAMKVTKIKKIYAVIGGFHLRKVDDIALKTIEYFKKNKVEMAYPCHCVEDCMLDIFAKNFPNESIYAGSTLLL